jgi:DNA-binding transcriptional regulator YiaG
MIRTHHNPKWELEPLYRAFVFNLPLEKPANPSCPPHCGRCGETDPGAFYRCKGRKSGFQDWCKRCMLDAIKRHKQKTYRVRGYGPRLPTLKPSDIPEIRSLKRMGMSTRDLADRYGVTLRCIQDIFSGRTWSQVAQLPTKQTDTAA